MGGLTAPGFVFAALSSTVGTLARATERAEIPDKYKWDLTDLYPSEAAWLAAKEDLTRRIPGMARFQGHLGDSADSLIAALSFMMDLDRGAARLGAYASQKPETLSGGRALCGRHPTDNRAVMQETTAAAAWSWSAVACGSAM